MDIISLSAGMGGVMFTVLAFVVALSIIVFVHEYGHYIVGRWSGIHAEVFSLGFGPVLWSRRDRRGTLWQVAALPFGGYVKFMGDSNAASGRDGGMIATLSDQERRRTMHGAPLWARAATVAAGPVFNFILSILVFSAFIALRGIPVATPTIGALYPLPGAPALMAGDVILSVDGTPVPDLQSFASVVEKLPPAASVTYAVNRNGEERTITGPYPFPPRVAQLMTGYAAAAAGLRAGDVITAVDGRPISAFTELQRATAAAGDKAVTLSVWRPAPGATDAAGGVAGESFDVTVAPKLADAPTADGGFETKLLLGIFGDLAFEPATRTAGVGESVTGGVTQTWAVVKSSVSGIYHMVAGNISSCNLSGPIRMASFVGDAARSGVEEFFWRLAQISTAIGFLNLFPIPVLDGGHLVFHAWEAVTGRAPGERALRVLMSVGLVLILALMVFALSNDLFC